MPYCPFIPVPKELIDLLKKLAYCELNLRFSEYFQKPKEISERRRLIKTIQKMLKNKFGEVCGNLKQKVYQIFLEEEYTNTWASYGKPKCEDCRYAHEYPDGKPIDLDTECTKHSNRQMQIELSDIILCEDYQRIRGSDEEDMYEIRERISIIDKFAEEVA